MLSDYKNYVNTTSYHRVAVIISVVCIAIGLGVGFSVATNQAKNRADADEVRLFTVFSHWQMEFTTRFSNARSLAGSLASFASALASTPANMSASPQARMDVLYPEAFTRTATNLARDVPGVTSMSLCPGGVLAQSHSRRAPNFGFDLYNTAAYHGLINQMMIDGLPADYGPNPLQSRAGIAVYAWYPVFISNITSPANFWGAVLITTEVSDLLDSMNISRLTDEDGMDYVMWYTNAFGTVEVVASSDENLNALVMAQGKRMQLPIGEKGKSSFIAIYPKGGPVLTEMRTLDVVAVLFATAIGAIFVVLLLYTTVFLLFVYRHRHAPSTSRSETIYMAAVTLRGAQPIVDKAPLEAVQMFTVFAERVSQEAGEHGCYTVGEIGDRCVYVVSSKAEDLMNFSQKCVVDVSVVGGANHTATTRHHRMVSSKLGASGGLRVRSNSHTTHRSATVSHTRTHTQNGRESRTVTVASGGREDDPTTGEMASESSFISTVVCRPSVAIHAVPGPSLGRVYDSGRDRYFYGTGGAIGKLCAAVDQTRPGEVVWTESVQERSPQVCDNAVAVALTSHVVSSGGTTLRAACWWADTGDERDNEDPSTAMAAISDVYVQRMVVIVGKGRRQHVSTIRNDKSVALDDAKNNSKGSSGKSGDATAITRSSTILHIYVGDEARSCLDIVRKIVADEKGSVVSAHESTIVAAFNLLSAGGHHQMRAADTVIRLRSVLTAVPFVCSLHHGNISALIADGLVMCTGDSVATGRSLLSAALAYSLRLNRLDLAAPSGVGGPSLELRLRRAEQSLKAEEEAEYSVSLFTDTPTSDTDRDEVRRAGGPSTTGLRPALQNALLCKAADMRLPNGLCVMFCAAEMSSTYECEAIDVHFPATGGPLENLEIQPDPKGVEGAAVASASPSDTCNKGRIVYHLSHRKTANAKDDEWMYRLRHDEEDSVFAQGNAVFSRIANGEADEARRLWKQSEAEVTSVSPLTASNINKMLAKS